MGRSDFLPNSFSRAYFCFWLKWTLAVLSSKNTCNLANAAALMNALKVSPFSFATDSITSASSGVRLTNFRTVLLDFCCFKFFLLAWFVVVNYFLLMEVSELKLPQLFKRESLRHVVRLDHVNHFQNFVAFLLQLQVKALLKQWQQSKLRGLVLNFTHAPKLGGNVLS